LEHVGSQPVFEKINQRLKQATQALGGGQHVKNPFWDTFFGKDLITVHPLGCCKMASCAEQGFVNHKGQVFSDATGTQVHEGLYVCDGSIIPRSLGVNPLLTISALAERTCELIAQDRKLTIPYDAPSRPPNRTDTPQPVGITFTETMRGHLTTPTGETPYSCTLTIHSPNLDEMLTRPDHAASITGTVGAPALSAPPLTVHNGQFHLFTDDPSLPEAKEMQYRCQLLSEEGTPYFLAGVKKIRHDAPLDLWRDNTTLHLTVYRGDHADATVLGEGIAEISPEDFLRQLTTIRILNETSHAEKAQALARFGSFFAGTLFETYGGVVAKEHVFNPDAPFRKKRPLRTGAPDVHFFTTPDGLHLRLTRYSGGINGPVLLVHGLGVSSGIFSLDTIETNLVEYLYANGYDVWLLDWRASIELGYHHTQFTLDDAAQYDYPAALAKIQQVTGAAAVDVLAHCVGAATFTMSLLSGLRGVRSVILSQMATHFQPPLANRIKTGLYFPSVLKALGIESLTAYTDTHRNWADTLYDQALKLYPLELEEHCKSPVCHRASFMYGLLYEHEQLNELTHDCLHELLGGANITCFEHVAQIFRNGQLLRHDGADVYLEHLDRLALPITILHGAANQVNEPAGTELSYNLLCAKNGVDRYRRHVIPNYGHIDCLFGKQASRDVYPLILEHLQAQTQGLPEGS
jgi:cholesterol oxidase